MYSSVNSVLNGSDYETYVSILKKKQRVYIYIYIWLLLKLAHFVPLGLFN